MRRAVLDQVSGYRGTIGTGGLQANPVIIAFRPEPTLPVTTGSAARIQGDTLYLLPAPFRLDGKVVIPDPLVARSVLQTNANDAWDDGASFSLGAGTMTVELRPTVPLPMKPHPLIALLIGFVDESRGFFGTQTLALHRSRDQRLAWRVTEDV